MRKIYLHSSERGKGFGKKLPEHALNQAKALGFSSVILETTSVLPEAIGLCQKHGVVPIKADHLSERCEQAYIKLLTDAEPDTALQEQP
jgi:GNAT superfamily N-acetyltransferase